MTVGDVKVTPFEVRHPSGAPPYALRLALENKMLSFTGDTEWVESLVPAGRDADLYIMECYSPAAHARYHMNWPIIERNLPRIAAKRVMLTHMSDAMLKSAAALEFPA